MNPRSILEAILFVAEQPVPVEELAEVLEIPVETVQAELQAWSTELAERQSGITLRQVAGGWRCYSHPDAFPYLERFASTATASRLSNAALEVLAVVAYRQPVSRNQIAEIRGVDSDSAIYGTTSLFLEKLGLRSMEDLPPLADHVPPATIVETLEETFRADA
jgi:segregation and condensation protein B